MGAKEKWHSLLCLLFSCVIKTTGNFHFSTSTERYSFEVKYCCSFFFFLTYQFFFFFLPPAFPLDIFCSFEVKEVLFGNNSFECKRKWNLSLVTHWWKELKFSMLSHCHWNMKMKSFHFMKMKSCYENKIMWESRQNYLPRPTLLIWINI